MLSGFSLFGPASLLTRVRRTPKRREQQRLRTRRRLLLEQLEDRRLLAIDLKYEGPWSKLELSENATAGPDVVNVSNAAVPGLLRIDLGLTATFGGLSSPTASGLHYQFGSPTTSHWADIDLTSAGDVDTVSINTGDGNDTINVALSSPYVNNIEINPGAGSVTTTFIGGPTSVAGYVNVVAAAINLRASVTSGELTLDGPVTLTAPVTLSGASGTFKGTVQGPGNLTLNFTNATFEQAVGDGTALTPLTPIGDGSGPAITFVAGSSATFWSKVRTNSGIVEEGGSGWVTFQDNVTIVGGDTVTTFDGSVTLDGLLFTSDGAVTFGTAGDIDMLFVTTTPVTIDTTSAGVAGGAVTFNTISQLERNLTVLGKSTVEVTNTMDSFFLDGEAQLSITAPTSVTVAAGGVVGSVMKLGAVSINSGAVMLNDSVFTDGALVTLAGTGAITLATGKTITTTPVTDGGAGGAIVINATTVTGNVDLVGSLVTSGKSNATGPGGAGGLVTIATVNGTIAINTITTSGGSSANPGSNGGLAGSISLNTGSGNLITLNGNLTAEGGNGAGTGNGGAGGAVTLNDNVRLGADIAISTIPGTGGTPGLGGSVLVASGSTVNATGAGLQGLTVAAGSGSFTASGALGDSAALKSVDVTAANIALHNVTTTGTSPGYQHYHATTQIALDGAYNSAGAVITFDGPTVLNANTTVNTTNGGPATGADITFTGTLNDAAAFQHSLGLTSGTGGDVLFQGVVGATALGTVTVSVSADVVHASLAFTAASFTQTTGAGATTFDSTLTTKGANNTAGGMVSITTSGAVTVTGAIDSGGGNATTVGKAGGSVDLTGSTVAVNAITTNGSAAVSGAGGNAGAISITATVLNITLNGNVTALGGAGPPAGTAGTVTLTAVTGANQLGGFMKAANLRLLGSGTFTLDGAANDLAVIAADLNSAVNPGVVSFTDINDIEVGTVSGTNGIATGNPAAGGAVTINASGTITVNHPIDTSTGSGGGVSITGSVILNSGGTLTAAGGNITLHGSTDAASDLIIGADITSSTTMNLTAPRDILVRAKLETNGGTGSDIILTADSDHLPASGLGAGGVWVEAAGQLVSDDQVQLSGSDLFATGGGASPFDSVLVDGDSIVGTLQIDAAGSITIKDGDYAPSVADTIINGRVATTATATGGAILIRAQQDVLFGADGDVTGPSGTVTVTADWPAGNTGGGITMADGAVINAGSGDVALSADGNIALGQVQTTSPAGIAVNVSTTSGAISDNTAAETFNISALGTVTLSAKTGIGVSGTTASIEFSAPTMNATNTTSVGIYLNSIGVGAVNFNTINAQTAGNIELRSANDTTLTSVTAGNGSIQALTAQGGGTFTNVAHVVSSTDADANDITITASNGNVRFTLAGAVNAGTTAGDVFITASSGAIVDVLSDTAIDVIGQDVSLTALGDIGQTGTAAIDTEAVNLTTSSNSSSVAGLHGTWINEFDGVTVISATTTDGLISLSSGGPMTIRTVNAATGGATVRNVNLVTTSGDVTIGDSGGGTITTSSTAAGYVRISAAGGIVDSHAGNDITTQNLLLRATTGIGSADSLDTTVSNLAATNVTTSGNIQIRNTIDLTITTVTTVTPFGDTLSGVANSAAGTIVIMATGAVTVDQAVSDSGGGNIILAAEGQAAVDDLTINANVTASGDGGSISLYAGDTIFVQGTPTVRTISAAGAGAVLLSASTDYHNNNPIRNGYDGNGTMAATAGRVVMHDGSIVQSQSGNITLRGDGNVLLSIVNAHNDVSGGAGYVIVTADYAGVDGGMSDYAGAISDNLTGEAVNITGDQVALRAGTGIGSGTAPDDLDIDVAINTLVAVTASGDINVQDVDATNLVGGLTIETFDGLHGVTISNADGTATLNDDITIRASSPVDVTAGDPVENFDGGNIKLAAEGATTGDDLTLYDNVTVTGGDGTIDGDGNIYLYAGHTINLMLAAVVVSVDASGSVLLSAGTNFNNGSPLDGNNTGDVLMTSGSTVSSEDGDLTLLAPNNVQLSIVNANADTPPDGVRGNIIVTADYGGPVTPGTYPSDNAGAISDILTAETANLTGNLATLLAATGIGSGGGDSDIETNLTTLNALNSISGDIAINEVAAGFDLVVQQATQNGTTGSISLTTERGNLTVLAAGSGVRLTNVANATGTISLDANVTVPATDEVTRGNVVVDQVVTSQGGSITITADHDVTGANTGDISSNGGAIGITADANTDGPGGNNNGTIQLKGDITAVGGSVTLSLADCDGWLGDATVVAVDGRILSALNIIKNGLGALRLNRAGNTYTGLTTVNDGTLIVNGTLTDSVAGGGVVVTDNATLGGNGTINAVVLVAASGTLDPGDCLADGAAPRCSPQPGKLTVTSAPPEGGSTVAFEFGATFRVQLNGLIPGQATVGPPVDGGYDQLAVNGTVDLGGTTPPGANGATLERSVGFPMPVGAAFRVINNDLTELVSNQFNELPEGSFFHAGSYVMNISYQSGLNNNDVTLTHPGRYDFDAYLPDTDPYYYESVGPMYPGNTAQEYSASTGVGWLTTGLNVLPQVTGRFASEGDSLGRNTYPVGASPSETPVRLLRDLHFTYGQATFQVDAMAVDTMTGNPLLYQVLVTSGDYGLVHEHSEFTVSGNSFATATSPYTPPSQEAVTDLIQFKQLVFRDVAVLPIGVDSLTGQLQVKMRYAGTNTWWSAAINAVDIRPVTSVGLISIARVDGLSLDVPVPPSTGLPVSADGLTKDYYIGTNAVPNSVITVTTTNGTVLPLTPLGVSTTDLDSYLLGVQVLSDANGQFQFQIQRPAGTGGAAGLGTATIEAWELEGRSYGQVGQRYKQDYPAAVSEATPITHRWFDFNTSISPTVVGTSPPTTAYIGVLPNAVYSSATGYGWESPMMAQDRAQGPLPDDVRRDFHWGQSGTFWIEVTPGATYNLRALFGEVIPGQWLPGVPVIGEGSSRDPSNPGTTATVITISSATGSDDTIGATTPAIIYRPLINTFQSVNFTGRSTTDGILKITISVPAGAYEYFAINALAIWQTGAAPTDFFQLLAADAPTDQTPGAVLTQAALGPIVDEARARWVAFGLTADQSVTLQAMAYRVADLPSPALAEIDTTANSMLVDRDAVGRGWFIDPTPWEDSEYVLGQSPPGVDLLTVVMHEMGHTLGYQDLDSSQFPQALMALQLMPEQARRAPTGPLVTGTNPIQPSDVNGDGNVTPTDVLLLINRIDVSGGPLTVVAPDGSPMFYDVSADNFLSALDVLRVINYLNTPAVAQLSGPVLDSPSSTGPLDVALEIIPPAPAGSSPTAVGPPAPAMDQVVLPAAGMQSPVPVWPAAESEDWLDDLAADIHAAQPDELATDAIFQELGKI